MVDEDVLRLFVAALLACAAVFFFRLRALPDLLASLLAGGLLLGMLWAGFHRLGVRPMGGYWPGAARGMAAALLLFCLLPPGMPWLLAGLLAALAVAVEGVERKALVPLALSGVTAAWLLAWTWQARTGSTYIAPFDFHSLDEPIALWVRFRAAVEPIRTYAGQVAGPLGATSFGLAALGTLLLSYARAVSWHLVLGFYLPVLAITMLGQRPLHVYLMDAPGLVFVAMIAADSRRLPRSAAWRVATGLLGGAIAAVMLAAGGGLQAFGLGVAAATALVTVFQYFGLAGAPGTLERRNEARRDLEQHAGTATPEPVPPGRRGPALQLVALAVFLPVGLVLVWRDPSLDGSQRRALVGMGTVLYLAALAASLAWYWWLRLPA
jgi:hypothetical protein